MGKWTKTAGLIFLAASSVYSTRAIVAATENRATVAAAPAATNAHATKAPVSNDMRLIGAGDTESPTVTAVDSKSDPFAAEPTSAPTTNPAAEPPIESAESAKPEGQSVSGSEVKVSDVGTVEIHVNDANLVEVLRMLSLQSQKNIVASKEVRGTITANLYDVTVREALDAILHANGYAYREKGNFIYVYTTKEIAEIEKAERQMKTEVFRVFYTPAANAANMIKPVLSLAGGQVAVTTPPKVGISSSAAGGGGNDHADDEILVVTDYPENIEAARKILAEVDRRPQQILLEAVILRAVLNEDNALGVDFTVLGGVDFTTLTSAGQNTGNALSGTIKDAAPPGDPLAPNPQDIVANNYSAGGTGFTQNVPAGGLRVGFVSNNVSVFLSALEQITDTTVLANPKILALNKQQGEVFVGNEDGYYTTLTTETSTSQSVESLKTGTRLIFRPFISSDGYIRMEVHPEDSDGQVKANGLPSKTTTEVTSNVMIKDGHTIVIGGLFRESTSSAKSQVPFLGNLPLAGALFKSQRDRTVREEVIILLTPHIVKDDAAYSKISEEELRKTDQLRVGLRRGMMPWGRERLAESAYDAAKKELDKPNPNRRAALWHLNCATNLNPKFSEAIVLKEQLSGREITSVDNSSVRGLVRRLMLADPDLTPMTSPSTLPTTTADASAAPTTMPTAQASATTQPSNEAVAEAPSTRPAEVEETVAVAAPSTQPTEESTPQTTETVATVDEEVMAEEQTEEAPEAETVVTVPLDEQSAAPVEKSDENTTAAQNSTATEIAPEVVTPDQTAVAPTTAPSVAQTPAQTETNVTAVPLDGEIEVIESK